MQAVAGIEAFGNPSLTIIANAIRIADHLLADRLK
jgi:hypothetical protein